LIEELHEKINEKVVSLLEAQRANFATGWPGVPPLDPYFIKKFEAKVEALANLTS
jgi:hypothetical protein